jgi:hypothetical protein
MGLPRYERAVGDAVPPITPKTVFSADSLQTMNKHQRPPSQSAKKA